MTTESDVREKSKREKRESEVEVFELRFVVTQDHKLSGASLIL